MTPAAQPHPLRCENGCGWYQTHYVRGCDVLERALTIQERDMIALVGCASHTAASQRIEQVIEELEERCEGSEDAPEYTRAVCEGYREAIALLQAAEVGK